MYNLKKIKKIVEKDLARLQINDILLVLSKKLYSYICFILQAKT